MDYNKIISITGMPGLYELLSSRADGAVVKSLEDGSTKFASSRQHQFSHLESIEIYTTTENTYLGEVFEKMKNSDEKVPESNADAKTLKGYFEKVVPDMDFERVFNSDMKKIVKWYHILDKNKIDFTAKSEEKASTDAKPTHADNTHVKEMKPQQTNPRKVESRGVK